MSKRSEHQNLTKFVKTDQRTQKKTRKIHIIHSQMWMHIKYGEEKKSTESSQNQTKKKKKKKENKNFKQKKKL